MLTIASLLSIILTSFHHVDDVVRGYAPGNFSNLIPILILLVWLYGTLALAGRRSGYIIILIASFIVSGLPLVHMRGAGLAGGRIAPNSSGAFFWVWQNFTLCVISLFAVILSVRGLWSLPWRRPRQSNNPNM